MYKKRIKQIFRGKGTIRVLRLLILHKIAPFTFFMRTKGCKLHFLCDLFWRLHILYYLCAVLGYKKIVFKLFTDRFFKVKQKIES